MARVDSPRLASSPWQPPYDWARGQGDREATVRKRVQALRAILPPEVVDVVIVAPGANPPTGVVESLLPSLTAYCHRAERNALVRHLHAASARSRAGRLVRQVGQQGKSLWQGFRTRGKGKDGDAA